MLPLIFRSDHPDPHYKYTDAPLCPYELSVQFGLATPRTLRLQGLVTEEEAQTIATPNATSLPVITEELTRSSKFFQIAFSPTWHRVAEEEEEEAAINFVLPGEHLTCLHAHIYIHIIHGCAWANCSFLRRVEEHVFAQEG